MAPAIIFKSLPFSEHRFLEATLPDFLQFGPHTLQLCPQLFQALGGELDLFQLRTNLFKALGELRLFQLGANPFDALGAELGYVMNSERL